MWSHDEASSRKNGLTSSVLKFIGFVRDVWRRGDAKAASYLEEEVSVSKRSGCDLSMPRVIYEFAIGCASASQHQIQQPRNKPQLSDSRRADSEDAGVGKP
jgi:uncharacterized protein YraI